MKDHLSAFDAAFFDTPVEDTPLGKPLTTADLEKAWVFLDTPQNRSMSDLIYEVRREAILLGLLKIDGSP